MKYAAVAAAILAFVALWIWQQGAERRAIRSMPDPDRALLYQRTLQDLELTCRSEQKQGFTAYCDRQARFILQFEECDQPCQGLAKDQLRAAAR